MSNQRRFLIIDPQEGFHPGGPLGVKGANEDSGRIIAMLNAYGDAPVYVSLDSHTEKHIGHYGFWKKSNTLIGDSVKDLQGNPIEYEEETEKLFIQPPGKDKVYIKARNKNLRTYAINYVQKLRTNSDAMGLGKVPMLWPTHCVIGDKDAGRAIYPPLFTALEGRENVKYYKKGENELAEMYSIFKSELQPNDIDSSLGAYFDGNPATSGNLTGNIESTQITKIQKGKKEEGGAYLNTEFNDKEGSLYSELTKGATSTKPVDIYICGQALSHCVNYSLRDLVEKLQNDNKEHIKVHLVLNCSSTVVLEPGPKFFRNSVRLIDDILKNYNKYCDIVFWDGNEIGSNEEAIEDTIEIFAKMAGNDGFGTGNDDSGTKGYDEVEYQKYLGNKFSIKGEVALTKIEGGKRTKKKRHSKTKKKRKGQVKKSKRRSSRK